jgi:hypothetical protein
MWVTLILLFSFHMIATDVGQIATAPPGQRIEKSAKVVANAMPNK